uniref:Uncharacterized protein n=1 Tax=Phocoena sinus TaxID=42100 RepID=A0A8C9C6M1_PHOSS
MLLIQLLNGNVSSRNTDIKLSRSIVALRRSFGVIEFTRQVGYAKREMPANKKRVAGNNHVSEFRSRSSPC